MAVVDGDRPSCAVGGIAECGWSMLAQYKMDSRQNPDLHSLQSFGIEEYARYRQAVLNKMPGSVLESIESYIRPFRIRIWERQYHQNINYVPETKINECKQPIVVR